MEMNINKEQLKGFGKVGLKIGKAIVVEGSKALLIKGAASAITASFDDGFEGVKNLTLDDVLEGKKRSKRIDDVKEANEIIEEISKTEVTK